MRKQNAAKVKDLNERIRKLVQKNCRILDKVDSRNWCTHINSLSKDKKHASPVNVDVNNLNMYYNSFSNDPNGQPQLEKIEIPTGEIPCFYPLEVYHHLDEQKRTSHESSGLPFWIFTYAAETIAELICSLFNLILLSRTVPDFFKISNIRPIPEVARPTLPNHFRPIAATRILSRLFERILYNKYIKKPYSTYICSKQFGFQQNSSTCSALINLLHDVYSLRKNYNYIRLITLEMSKAFDTIQHSEIFKEISRCVPLLNEYVVDVLKCFLTSRSHYTSLGSEMLLNFGRHDVPLISGIDRKSSVNLLGILFDEKLSFNDNVKCITKRATAKLYVVFRLRRIGFSIRELTLLYKSLVLPTLTYCCSVWGGTSDENLRKIDRVQQFVLGSSTSTVQ